MAAKAFRTPRKVLADLEHARAEALEALGQIAKDELPDGDRREFKIVIRSEVGQLLLTASLFYGSSANLVRHAISTTFPLFTSPGVPRLRFKGAVAGNLPAGRTQWVSTGSFASSSSSKTYRTTIK
jgi:hypothetical protein